MLQGATGVCILCPEPAPAPVVRRRPRAPKGAAGIQLSKRHLSHFIRKGWHVLEPSTPLEWSWHIDTMANHIQWMLEQWMGRKTREVTDLIINVPPGSLKSLALSVFAPAWMWIPENAPHWSLMSLSGSKDVVIRDARKMRRLINSEWYRENFLWRDGRLAWEISKDQDALTDFSNTVGGVRHSQTSNAAVTGQRYDCITNDDPNDVKDISKVKLRQAIASWKAAGNRINDMRKASRIIIQQRTHELDLSGYVLEKNKGNPRVQHLCIPMEYTEAKCACGVEGCDTTLGKSDPRTVDGEVLHEERNTPDVIADEKLRLGSLGTAGQLNQRPAPEGGEMFKLEYWRYFDELPRDRRGYLLTDTVILSCDLQVKKTGTSKTCLMVIASKGSTRYILDVVNRKMGILDSIEAIRAIYAKWNDVKSGRPLIKKILIEGKANGPAVMETLDGELPGMVEDNPTEDKESRANAVLPTTEAGNVRLLRDAPWLDEFRGQLAAFPNGAYDDIMDAYSQGITDLVNNKGAARLRALCGLGVPGVR